MAFKDFICFAFYISVHYIRSSRQSRHSFQYILSERLAYCPSQNRTCGFPAYGSSNSHSIPDSYIGCQMRFCDIIIPYSQILFKSESSFLVSSVEHSVCAILNIFTEVLYRLAEFYNVTTDYILGKSASRTNLNETYAIKLTNKMTIGDAVEIMTKMNDAEREHLAYFIEVIGKSK